MLVVPESGNYEGKRFPDWGEFDVELMPFNGEPIFHIDIPYELYPLDADPEEDSANFTFTLRDALESYFASWRNDDPEDVAATAALLREYAAKLEAHIAPKPRSTPP